MSTTLFPPTTLLTYVCVGRSLLEEQATGELAEVVHVAALYVAVGTGEVDVFHCAHEVVLEVGVSARPYALVVDSDYLSGLEVAYELRTHHVQRAGLAADDISVAEGSDRERPEAVLVAAGVDAVLCHYQERERPLHHVQGLLDRQYARTLAVLGVLAYQVGEDLAVGARLEQGPVVLEVAAQLVRVYDVAVVGYGEVAGVVVEEERLHVVYASASRGRVPDMAYGHVAFERGQAAAVEYFGDQTLSLYPPEFARRAAGYDSASLLTPVLQGVQAVIHQIRGARDAVDSEDSALFAELSVLKVHNTQM